MLAPVSEQLGTDQPAVAPGLFEVALGVARVFGELDEEAAHRYIATDFIDHEASPGVATGPAGYLSTARYMRSAFSDARWQADDFVAAGDKFAVRVTFTGVHTGDVPAPYLNSIQAGVQESSLASARKYVGNLKAAQKSTQTTTPPPAPTTTTSTVPVPATVPPTTAAGGI